MPQYQVEALRTIRSLQAAYATGGRTAQAEQMRKVGDQVEAMAEEIAALKEQAELHSFYEVCFDDVERIEKALLFLGESTPESKEERSARWRELLMRLTSAVLRARNVYAEIAALKAAALVKANVNAAVMGRREVA